MNIDLRFGDCIEIMSKMNAECVDMICTDPPYRTVTGGDSGDRPKGMLSGNRKLFEHQNDIEISAWMPLVFKVLRQGCHAYIFTNSMNLYEMLGEATRVGFKLHNILVWEKNNCTPSQFYMKNCEYVLFLRKGKAKWINNIGNSKTVHKFNNVIGNKVHPCEKPVDLLRYYIENSTSEGDTVLDPFMGSASCGTACLLSSRNFIGVEKDKLFFDIASERMRREQEEPHQQEIVFY